MGSMKNLQAREAHYKRHLGKLDQPVMHSTDDNAVHVDIYQFAPTRRRDYWTLVTGGMSDQPQQIPAKFRRALASRTELMMYVRKPAAWMFSVLKGLAAYPFESDSYVHWYHTIPNGKPMTAKPSLLSSWLIIPPIFEKQTFDALKLGRNRVNFLWVIPITEAERAFATQHGSEALQQVMASRSFNPVVNERRKSLV